MKPQHVLVFKIYGTNKFGADVGGLTLFTNGTPALTSSAFSGGPNSPAHSAPLPTGQYNIRLDIRQVFTKYSEAAGDSVTRMHHWYGIEKIDEKGWQWEWGHYRAALNERDPNLPGAFRGNFLHGKVRPDDWTHGCICERSEVILQHLWSMSMGKIDVRVER